MRARALAIVASLVSGCGLDLLGTGFGDAVPAEGIADGGGRADATVAATEAGAGRGIPIDDAAAAADAFGDAPIAAPPDAGASGITCPGHSQVSSCEQCAGAPFQCGTSCIADCGSCPAAAYACYQCGGSSSPQFCADLNGFRLCGAVSSHCGCPLGRTDLCPGANNVCVFGVCGSCGEPLTEGRVCKGTGACTNAAGKFACK
jgi:hypothetical protein